MTAPLLVVEGLCKRFGALLANDEITFEACPRELHALIGPNGAGKTTLINQLSGAVPSDDGRIGCSPDRTVMEKGGRYSLVEIKCPAPWTHIGYLLDGPGADYRQQVQGQLLVTGAEFSLGNAS